MRRQTIGIVGGGQLGRMLTVPAKQLGFDVVVVDPGENCPAAQVGAEQIVGDLYDKEALKKLAEKSDFITVEIEHLDTKELEAIEKLGQPVNPSPRIIRLIQDKYRQKVFLREAGIPTAEIAEITEENAVQIFKKFGGKMLLKTKRGAYDGRGNMLVKSHKDLERGLKQFADAQLYAEKFVPFVKELAVMVVRSKDGEIKSYPIVETIHERNICIEVLAPAEVSEPVAKKAEELAREVVEKLGGVGVFGIEMFLTRDGKVLINEIAPRVHNSGHYTMDACATSQFEQHIRAVTGLPLGDTKMLVTSAVMMNILGERNGPTEVKGLREALTIEDVSVHLYGKSPTKIDRKMGHINAIGEDLQAVRRKAEKARKAVSI
jgi:5-(carboxyamino)imidazole ribonucleotide synthase